MSDPIKILTLLQSQVEMALEIAKAGQMRSHGDYYDPEIKEGEFAVGSFIIRMRRPAYRIMDEGYQRSVLGKPEWDNVKQKWIE